MGVRTPIRRVSVSTNSPRMKNCAKKWIAEVQRTRVAGKNKNWIPGPGTFVCSQHYEECCFDPCVKLREEVSGWRSRRRPSLTDSASD